MYSDGLTGIDLTVMTMMCGLVLFEGTKPQPGINNNGHLRVVTEIRATIIGYHSTHNNRKNDLALWLV